MDIPREKFEEWLSQKGLGSRSIENYLYYLDNFHYPTFNQENVFLFLSTKKNSNIVARSFVKNLKRFLIQNYVELGISDSEKVIISGVELPKFTGRKAVKVPVPIPYHMIDVIESKLKNPKNKLQFRLTYHSGLRSQELLRIRPVDFNWEEWKLDMEKAGECVVFGKGNKQRTAIVPSFVMKMTARYIRQNNFGVDDKIFFTKNTKGNIQSRARNWRLRLSEAGILAGVTKRSQDGAIIEETRVHPHRLRHSFASHCKDRGVDINEIKELMGHSSIQSTQIYLHNDKSKMKEKIEEIYSS